MAEFETDLLPTKEFVLAVDLDDTVVDTTGQEIFFYQQQFPGKPDRRDNGKMSSEILDPRWDRRQHRRKTEHIYTLSFLDGALSALSIYPNYFNSVVICSARWEDQRDALSWLLIVNGQAQYAPSMILRQKEEQDQVEVKLQAVREVGINYAIEDHGPLAVLLAEEGAKVALIDKPSNRWILNSPNIRRYGGAIDFALDLILHGGPEQVFDAHRLTLDNPESLTKVHKWKLLHWLKQLVTTETKAIPFLSFSPPA